MNHNTALDAALGGWRVAGTLIYQSGTPFTVTDSNIANYSQAGTEYINPASGVSPHSGACSNGAAAGTVNCWFNPAAFTDPAAGTFGTIGRNTLFGPRLSDINLSLAKTWHYKERVHFQLRGDFINAFNHPSFSLPNSNNPSTSGTAITSVANNARTIQLGAHLTF
jgi:hypothetical protein